MWHYNGRRRPPFALTPEPGQESAWDYPRPPRIEADRREIVVAFGDVPIARTRRALRVLETASPPTFYLPPADVDVALLARESGRSYCEWKGEACYWSVVASDRVQPRAAWSYPAPKPAFGRLQDHFGFYPGVLACFVDGERVQPQPGRFYAGWITSEVMGPFKGAPGTEDW